MESISERMTDPVREPEDFLKRIRQDTMMEHTITEKAMPVFDEGFDRQSYQSLLQKMYGFYAAYELEMDKAADGFGDFFRWDDRKKLPLLRRDLESLGLTEKELRQIPQCKSLPYLSSVAKCVGMMYVMEGSTLGGSIISRHLSQNFAGEWPCDFFHAYGPRTAVMWKDFQKAARVLVTDRTYSEVVATAKTAFTEMRYWLQGRRVD